jgi:hypothetical protein
MGRYLIPCCVICGRSPGRWHDPDWEAAGGEQDLCPQHANDLRRRYGDLLYYAKAAIERRMTHETQTET